LAGAAAGRRTGARRWWLALVALAAAVAALTDLVTHAGPDYHRAQLRAYLSAAAHDVAQCQAGLRDAVQAYSRWADGTPGADRATAAVFTRQGISVCGFANSGVVQLTSDQPGRPIASPAVDRIAPAIARWAYLDAFTFLQDLRVAIGHPRPAARARAERELAALTRQRERAESLAGVVERAHHLRGAPLRLVQVSSLLPGGVLPAPRGAAQ